MESLAQESVFSAVIRRSRFIAWARGVGDGAAVEEALSAARRRWPGADHYPYAWRLEPASDLRASDDGEPRGTAGLPILNALRRADLCFTLVVVVRYFGGVRLGVEGLKDAYRAAAEGALGAAARAPVVLARTVAAEVAYGEWGRLRHCLDQAGIAYTPAFTQAVHAEMVVPEAAWQSLQRHLEAIGADVRSVSEVGWRRMPVSPVL